MSTRRLRQLQLAQERAAAERGGEEQEELVQEERPQKKSAFAAMTALDDDDDDDNDDDDNRDRTPPTSSQSAPAKKKKNKKKSKSSPREEDEDERALAEALETKVNVSTPANENEEEDNEASEQTAHRAERPPEFAIDFNELNPDEEVIRKLGRGVKHRVERSAEEQQAMMEMMRRRRGKRRVIQLPKARRAMAKYYFTSPDPEWPSPPTFVTGEGARAVVTSSTTSNVSTFTFEASESYQAAERHFLALVATHDPNNIVHMVQQHPFHVDALLQLHDIFVSTQQNETAQVFLRRALFSLETFLGPIMRGRLGGLRLEKPPSSATRGREGWDLRWSGGRDAGLNGAFLRALVTAMRLAGRRDCFDTALALARLLLSLAPADDPCHVRLCIDYYALKAGKASWIVDFGERVGLDGKVLPNAAFSRALALRGVNRSAEATSELKSAIERYPTFTRGLLGDAELPPRSKTWLDKACEVALSPAMEKLVEIGVTRQLGLWSVPEIRSWLRGCLYEVANAGDRPNVREEETQTQRRYAQASTFDFTDQVSVIPQEALRAEDRQQQQEEPREWGEGWQRGEDEEEEEAEIAERAPNVNLAENPLMLFIRTLLPWAVLPTRREGEEDDEANDDDNEEEERT